MTTVTASSASPETAAPRPPRQPQRRIVRRAVDGVLLLDKPSGISSNAALQTARRLYNAARAGHTGTLDPMASGLLPLAFGEATKFSQMLLEADKTYLAQVRLGVETDSGDAEGRVLRSCAVLADRGAIESVLTRFRGEIQQLPPMYSALKRDGKPLYEYARAGIEVERRPRAVRIDELQLLEVAGDAFTLRVSCSKGTYIRSLAMDIGAALGCGAHLSALRRTRVGAFGLAEAVTLTALEAAEPAARDAMLAPVDALVAGFALLQLDAADALALLQGRVLQCRAEGPRGLLRAWGPQGFLGLVERDADDCLRARRLISTVAVGAAASS